MSSGGAEYFSPGRESGGKVRHDHAPEGPNGSPHAYASGREFPNF